MVLTSKMSKVDCMLHIFYSIYWTFNIIITHDAWVYFFTYFGCKIKEFGLNIEITLYFFTYFGCKIKHFGLNTEITLYFYTYFGCYGLNIKNTLYFFVYFGCMLKHFGLNIKNTHGRVYIFIYVFWMRDKTPRFKHQNYAR